MIRSKKENSSNQDIPAKLGRKTLEELTKLKKIDLDKSLEFLRSKGIEDITKDYTIKDISDELGLKPIEVYQLLIMTTSTKK